MKQIFVILLLISFMSSCSSLRQNSKPIVLSGEIFSEVSAKDWIEKPYVEIKPADQTIIKVDNAGNYIVENLEKNKEYTIEISGWVYYPIERKIKLNKSTKLDFALKTDDRHPYNGINAQNDIENGNTRFLISSGIVGIANSPSDEEFENKYKIEYLDFGCVSPSQEIIRRYNSQIATYLDRAFGKEWREKIRRDVKYTE